MATRKTTTKVKSSNTRFSKGLGLVKKANPIRLFQALSRSLQTSAQAIVNFLRGSIAELRTVAWLSRQNTLKFSVYILLFIILGSLVIAAIDLGFYKLIAFITTSS